MFKDVLSKIIADTIEKQFESLPEGQDLYSRGREVLRLLVEKIEEMDDFQSVLKEVVEEGVTPFAKGIVDESIALLGED